MLVIMVALAYELNHIRAIRAANAIELERGFDGSKGIAFTLGQFGFGIRIVQSRAIGIYPKS